MDGEPQEVKEAPKPRIKDEVHFSDDESRKMLAALSSWIYFEMINPKAPAFKRISKGPGDIKIERVFMMRKTPDGVPVQFTHSTVTKNAKSADLPEQTEVSLRVEVPQPDVKEQDREFIKYQITYNENGRETLVERHYNPTKNKDFDAAKKLMNLARNTEPDKEGAIELYNQNLDKMNSLNHLETPNNDTVADLYPLGHRIIPLKRL